MEVPLSLAVPVGFKRRHRAFGSDTEAGRLLKKLYGGNSKPQIKYPKLTTKQREPAGPFIPAGGVAAMDARSTKLAAANTARAVRVPAPCSNQATHQLHAIDVLPIHRRPKEIIDKELAQIKRSIEGYHPRVSKHPGSKEEKEKLQQKFTYLPGSILPPEMLPGADLLGKELRHQDALREAEPKSTLSELRKLAKQVNAEIEDRKQYAANMAALGKPVSIVEDLAGLYADLKQIQQLIHDHSSV
ncbi:hypothetical protein ACHHYP_07465 [Achlya hypogyna]|uniref:Uncharacterized protein n=1 Tax=Achlya hypogyna TaxID=1202772 RepID=A0A1V9ZLU2_ACHHY|nr:hypothetical protein ACHHYP_07465 [Achlya hypogyna]